MIVIYIVLPMIEYCGNCQLTVIRFSQKAAKFRPVSFIKHISSFSELIHLYNLQIIKSYYALLSTLITSTPYCIYHSSRVFSLWWIKVGGEERAELSGRISPLHSSKIRQTLQAFQLLSHHGGCGLKGQRREDNLSYTPHLAYGSLPV